MPARVELQPIKTVFGTILACFNGGEMGVDVPICMNTQVPSIGLHFVAIRRVIVDRALGRGATQCGFPLEGEIYAISGDLLNQVL